MAAWVDRNRLLIGAIVIAFALSGLSLFFNHAIDYDPAGWIVYGRELLGDSSLNTTGFPAWKPLPAFMIAPFTLLSRGTADIYYWLFITRACGVLLVFSVAALAHRFGGILAALLAGFLLIISPWWAIDAAIGRDSSIAALFFITAFLAHYHGWHRWAIAGIVLTTLSRPEAAPFLILYELWMWRTKRVPLWFLVPALAVAIVPWGIPTIFHAGLAPSTISQNSGGAGTPVNSGFPFGSVLVEAMQQLREPVAVMACLGILATAYGFLRRGRRDRISQIWGRDLTEQIMLAVGLAWVVVVAAESQVGHYSGNSRYLVPGLVVLIVVASVVTVRLPGSRKLLGLALGVIIGGVTLATSLYILTGASVEGMVKQRDAQLYNITWQSRALDCPRDEVADHNNNAYLAVIRNQPLQDSIKWTITHVNFADNAYWYVYCTPPKT